MRGYSIPPARASGAAFTLLELVLSVSIMSILLLALVVPSGFLMQRAETERTVQSGLTSVEQCLAEMEGAIRSSTAVGKASSGILEISTTYYFDLDDETEVVRYTLVGDQLRRQLAPSGTSFDPPVTLLEGLQSFSAFTCGIHDDFARADYDTVLPLGDALTLNTAVDTAYKILDLGVVDADLMAAYDSTFECLDLHAVTTYVTATVAPPLERDGMSAHVSFYPRTSSKEYRPLVYGNETPDTTNVSVIFASDQRILLRKSEGGAAMEAVSTATWSANDSYQVGLEFRSGKWMAWTDNGSGLRWIGSVSAGSLDNQRLHLQVNSTGAQAGFDSVSVEYPEIKLEMTVEFGDGIRNFVGSATRRMD